MQEGRERGWLTRMARIKDNRCLLLSFIRLGRARVVVSRDSIHTQPASSPLPPSSSSNALDASHNPILTSLAIQIGQIILLRSNQPLRPYPTSLHQNHLISIVTSTFKPPPTFHPTHKSTLSKWLPSPLKLPRSVLSGDVFALP